MVHSSSASASASAPADARTQGTGLGKGRGKGKAAARAGAPAAHLSCGSEIMKVKRDLRNDYYPTTIRRIPIYFGTSL